MRIAARILRGGLVPLVSLLLLAFLSVMPSVAQHTKQTSEEEIRVLANLPLQDIKVNQMFVKEWDSKVYLYLHQPKRTSTRWWMSPSRKSRPWSIATR